MNCFRLSKRLLSTQITSKPKICIVGAGAAGFYACQHLLKKLPNAQLDLYEKLPVPFGLVRFGVAPDHPEVKNVINTFTKTAEMPQVRFIGNVDIGKDVTVQDLRNAYNIVILTYGADQNRTLNIPGENLKNSISARNLVGWYNGAPWDQNLDLDLNCDSVAIFGQGNVAVDVARILLAPIDLLKKTDITAQALAKLATSQIKRVHLIGRRGPLQAAYTIKELREMIKLDQCAVQWRREDFRDVSHKVDTLQRPKKRIAELMLSSLEKQQLNTELRVFKPIFYRSPIELIGENKVEAVNLAITELDSNNKAIQTDKNELLQCQLAISSIGYKSTQIDNSIPFDFSSGTAKNDNFKMDRGLYSSGWLATGPTGVILTTMNNAFATSEKILKDAELDSTILEENKPGFDSIDSILRNKNVQVVSWKDWTKIDDFEKKEGEKMGKPREKLLDVKEMLNIAAK